MNNLGQLVNTCYCQFGQEFVITPAIVTEQTAAAITYTGTWTSQTSPSFSAGASRYSAK